MRAAAPGSGTRPPGMVAWWLNRTSTRPHTKEVTVAQSTDPLRLATNSIPFATSSSRQQGSPSSNSSRGRSSRRPAATATISGAKRIYTPWITLGIFLSQVLSDDHSCDDAVDRFQKFRYDQGLPRVATSDRPATARPGNACPRRLLWDLVRRTGPIDPRESEPSAGSSTAERSRSSTARPCSCPIPRRTRRRTPKPTTQAPGVGVPDRPHPRDLQPGRGDGARGGDRALPGQADQRTGLAPADHRRSSSPATSSWPTASSARTG